MGKLSKLPTMVRQKQLDYNPFTTIKKAIPKYGIAFFVFR